MRKINSDLKRDTLYQLFKSHGQLKTDKEIFAAIRQARRNQKFFPDLADDIYWGNDEFDF